MITPEDTIYSKENIESLVIELRTRKMVLREIERLKDNLRESLEFQNQKTFKQFVNLDSRVLRIEQQKSV